MTIGIPVSPISILRRLRQYAEVRDCGRSQNSNGESAEQSRVPMVTARDGGRQRLPVVR